MVRKRITIQGIELSYLETRGTASGTVFFIHGNSEEALLWQPQLEAPSLAGWRRIAIDLPGHGQSGELQPEQYNLPFMASILAGAVSTLSGDHRSFLVGFSLGANLVAEMLRYAIQPAGIVLISPTITGPSLVAPASAEAAAKATVFYTDAPPEAFVREVLQLACFLPEATVISRLLAAYQQVRPPFRSALLQAVQAGYLYDETALLQAWGKPVLILFGAKDVLVNPHYLDSAGLLTGKEGIIQISDAGHFVPLEKAETVTEWIGHYFSAHSL